MKEYNSIWYKDFWSILLLFLNWLVFLFLLNFAVVLWFWQWNIPWYYYLAIVVFWLGFYVVIRIVNNISYTFSKSWITINSVGKKEYFLEKDNISSIEYIWKVSWMKWFWVRYNFFTGEVLFTTGLSNVYKINTKDGKQVLISPKNLKKDFFNFYNS